MMKAFNLILVISVALLISCYTPQEDIDLAKPIEDWVIPDDFDFKTYEKVELNIDLFPFGGDYFEIYSDANYSELMASFRTDSFGRRVLKSIKVPAHLSKLYIKSSIGEFSVAMTSKIKIDLSTLDNQQKNNSNSRVASSGRGNSGEHFGYYCAHAQISHDFDLIFLRTGHWGHDPDVTVSFYYDEDLTQPAVDYDGHHSVVVKKEIAGTGIWEGQHLKVPTENSIKYFYVHEYDEIVPYDFSCDDISNIDGSKTIVGCLGAYQDKIMYYAFTPDNDDAYHDYGDGDYPWWFSYLTVEWMDVSCGQTFYTTEFASYELYFQVEPDVAIAKNIIFNRGEDVFPLSLDDCPDEFPRDFLFSQYYPYKGGAATMVFEDLWPEKGDYDFNDLVVEYNIEYKYNFGSVMEIIIDYTVKHVGASLQSGFVVQSPLYSIGENCEIEGTIRTDNFIEDEPSGYEAGHNVYDKHIVVFDNASKLVTPYSFDEFFNGKVIIKNMEDGYFVPDLEFYSFSNTQIDSLRHLGRRSKEIHMADKKGSKLAYSGFYGLADDTSDPLKTRYYRTINNLPWAFEIPTTFNLPDERQPITEKYPRFASWAQSGGELDKDWYMD